MSSEGSSTSTDEVCARVSSSYNHPDFDIIVQSSDRVLFKVHRRNLEMHSQVFADAAGATSSSPSISSTAIIAPGDSSELHSKAEIIHLSESSAVLDLMLQYMYLQPQPDLNKVDFEVVKDLAEAVEKYSIYSAMGVLNVRMRENIHSHPVEVLSYAIKHNYPELINESAETTLDSLPYTMLQRLPAEVFGAWLSYQQTYHVLLSKEFTRFGPKRSHSSTYTSLPHPGIFSSQVNSAEGQGCKSWCEHYAMITSVIGPGFGYTEGNSARSTFAGGSGTLAGLGGPSNRSAFASTSVHTSTPTSSLGFQRLLSTLERRRLLAEGEGCGDCKRELGHWIQQAERDWRNWREGNGGGRFHEYL
ncbi:hypothetical protein VKT23_012518 [Stygiomarasmius scandens]|uniref:BTB domain-containing protein n=1 Tax=Marasmiellus scandens TaxID=2682957 RepID=A0ABR1J5H5_9AGAR